MRPAAPCDAALASSVGDLNRILSRLMSVEALLATGQSGSDKVAPLDPETVAWLEGRIDVMQEVLKPIDKCLQRLFSHLKDSH